MAGVLRGTFLGMLGAAFAAACGGSEPEPQTQFQAGTMPPPTAQPGQPMPPQTYPTAQPTAAAPAATAPAPALPGMTNAAPAPTAQAVDPSMAALAQPVLNQLAATEAPGAKPLGAASAGMFQAGQQLETVVTMQPGKCYTVIGVGLPAVSEVNIQLVAATPVPGMNPVLAQDQSTGPQAVLGKAPNCYKWAFPLPGNAKVLTSVAAGQGVALVQVYEK